MIYTSLSLDTNIINKISILDQFVYNFDINNYKFDNLEFFDKDDLNYLVSKCLETNNKELCIILLYNYINNHNFDKHDTFCFYSINKLYKISTPYVYTIDNVINWCQS